METSMGPKPPPPLLAVEPAWPCSLHLASWILTHTHPPLHTIHNTAWANEGGKQPSLLLFRSTRSSPASKPCPPAPAASSRLTTHIAHAVVPVLLPAILWC